MTAASNDPLIWFACCGRIALADVLIAGGNRAWAQIIIKGRRQAWIVDAYLNERDRCRRTLVKRGVLVGEFATADAAQAAAVAALDRRQN